MRKHPLFFCLGLALVALAGVATAGVFARIDSPDDAVRIWKLHEPKGGALVLGQVHARETIPTTLGELGEVEITALTIVASDLVSSRKDLGGTFKAYYLGGGEYRTSAQPADAATKPGTQAAFFLRPNEDSRFPGFWIDGSNSIVSAVKTASGETVVLGMGAGTVNSENRKAADFLATHRAAIPRVLKAGK